jgi:hypothetical protein
MGERSPTGIGAVRLAGDLEFCRGTVNPSDFDMLAQVSGHYLVFPILLRHLASIPLGFDRGLPNTKSFCESLERPNDLNSAQTEMKPA